MALKTVFEYCFNAIEFYPKSNRFVLASRRKSNHFVLKIRLGGFADYIFSGIQYGWQISGIHFRP